MPSSSDKWIRSIKDNPAGKVVAVPEGDQWEWESDDETSHLRKELSNDERAIESTNLYSKLDRAGEKTAAPATPKRANRQPKPGTRDSGGGFNPYDHAGKKRR